jgi:GDP-L-fucose synthase
MPSIGEVLRGKRIVVTGGTGFLGQHLRSVAEQEGIEGVQFLGSRDYDLTQPDNIRRMLKDLRPQAIIHAAAICGGIGANRREPARFFYANAVMGIHLLEESRLSGVEKFVQIGTTCSYPKFTPVPFREDDLWNGYPEETNAPYGIAKRALLVQLQAYRQQYGFPGIYLIPANLYGPYDHFNLVSSHVIPAMILKFEEARRRGYDTVSLWGDGSPTREFLHARDAARGIWMATAFYDGPEPVNLGTGEEISIRELADLVAKEVGYHGAIAWDTSMPNGQPRRRLDTSRARDLFGFQAEISLEEGIRETVEWYRANLTGVR